MDRYRGRAPYSGPLCGKITVQKRCEKIALWTAIGPWTAIGDGPLTGYFIYVSGNFSTKIGKNLLESHKCSNGTFFRTFVLLKKVLNLIPNENFFSL